MHTLIRSYYHISKFMYTMLLTALKMETKNNIRINRLKTKFVKLKLLGKSEIGGRRMPGWLFFIYYEYVSVIYCVTIMVSVAKTCTFVMPSKNKKTEKYVYADILTILLILVNVWWFYPPPPSWPQIMWPHWLSQSRC